GSRWFPGSGGDTGANSFYLRRTRPILEGTVYKNIGFRLMPDFGLGTTVIQDGYLELKYWPQAQLRLGKFKEPVSIERLQSAAQGLGFGVAGSWGRQKDPLSTVQYRTAGRSTFFKYDATAVGNGDRRRIVPQLYYYVGPFGLMGEYIDSKQAVRKGTSRADLT